MIVNNTNTSQHGHAIQGGERDKEIPLFSFQMPGKFGSLYQHSKQTQKSDTSTMFHQQFLCFSLPESLGQTVAENGGDKKKKKVRIFITILKLENYYIEGKNSTQL